MIEENLKLLPCPFCGEKAKHIIHTTKFGKGYGERKSYIGCGCINKNCRIKPQVMAVKESVTGMMRIETISLILAQANTKTLKLAGLGDEK